MRAFIESRKDDYIRDLKTLVNIDSSSDNLEGIEAVARTLIPRLEALGFDTRLEKPGNRGVPCLFACNDPESQPSDIMILGHMDTVFPTGEVEKRPFRLEDGRALGPGVADMKGGLLVALHVLEALHHGGVLGRLSIRVCFNGDEEVGSTSSREWIEHHARKSLRVFVFEPCRPGHRFVLQRKGGGGFRLTARGVSAHAGVEPEKGANAAVEIAHQVLAIQDFDQHAGEGTSVNVTVVQGGKKTNIIPDHAEARVDVRVAQKNDIEGVEAFFRSRPDNTRVPGVSLTVSGGVDRPPMEADERSMQLWQVLSDSATDLQLAISHVSTGGCSDGNFTSAQGIPTIDGMGPIGANAHRADEYVELDSVLPQIQLITSVCQSIAENKR
jgi:glutamate carboxypeptidase